jgi:formylmethanofuran dehydrogenase subunit B
MAAARKIHDFVCTACGCTCDDLVVTVEADRIASFTPPCPLAEQFLLATPADEEAASFPSAAVEEAASFLRSARAPLVMGFQRATVDAQRLAVGIADQLGAFLDPTDDDGVSQSHAAVQAVGAITATLGEAASRSDRILYWQCDPVTTHPRHVERFSSGAGRLVVVADVRRTATADAADEFVQLDSNDGIAVLWTLRALVQGVEVDVAPPVRQLAEGLMASRYATVFYNDDAEEAGIAKTQAISLLVRDLHRHTRAAALPLGASFNAVGAAQVLTWQTGFPAAVSFARGYPQYLPGEATAARLLARGEVDAALIIAADPLGRLPPDAAAHLRSIPTIVLDDRDTATMRAATIALRTARFGIETPGDSYRSDGVALSLRVALTATHPTAAEVLATLAAALAV